MTNVFHAGEIAVQQQAGVRRMANQVGNGIHNFIPSQAQEFLEARHWLVAASVASNGRVWASLLVSEGQLVKVQDEETILLEPGWREGDPIGENLKTNPALGMVILDPAHRRRMRLNGQAFFQGDGRLAVLAEQVYANCPKYIQAREITIERAGTTNTDPVVLVHTDSSLTTSQQTFISGTDTFFIASYNAEGGADASHRGGNRGFVRVTDPTHLVWPDYQGNMMFNTLGNLVVNNQSGLLFVDFEGRRLLQLTGRTTIEWNQQETADYSYNQAERLLKFEVQEVIEASLPGSVKSQFLSYSPFNPSPVTMPVMATSTSRAQISIPTF